jgi:hypothetical protein
MARLLNALFGRAYSYEDLRKECAPFLSNPKLPEGFPEILAHFDGRKRTFLEFIQLSFKDYLRQIANKGTKEEQKTELLDICLQELSWDAANRAVKDAKHVQSWEHIAKVSPLFEMFPKTEWKRLLLGRYMSALILCSWLTVLGRTLYRVEDYIESALELFVHYDAEIKSLDVGLFELMLEKLSNYEDDEGRKIGKFKDEVINPLIKEQYAILDRLAADIKGNSINVEFYRTQFSRIDEIKGYIARTVTASAIPN